MAAEQNRTDQDRTGQEQNRAPARGGKKKEKKKNKSRWEDNLIVAVSHYQIVYDKSLVDYRDKTKTGKAWADIAAAVGASG